MKTFAVALLFALSLSAAAGEADERIGYDGARHLLNRVGFGASDAEIRAFAPLTRREAVDRLLADTKREATLAPPAFVSEPFTPYYRIQRLSAEERMAAQRVLVQQGFELRAWWLREMLSTSSPFTERMTLFWHGHFATSQQKVRSNQLMYRQNVLLRREALGNFATMLREVARDPAMLVYLDNARSRSGAPNENFAREVMELFTLGEGHYGERDIKEAARAFTGWSLDRDSGEFTYRRAWHDYGEKSVLGRTGRLDGDDVLATLLAQPRAAEFITAKLWREFISPTPDARELRRMAKIFRDSKYELKPLMQAMLAAEAFWSPDNRASLIKSPVDVVVGTMRTFEIRPMDLRPAAFAVAALGQNPFAPPNVKGWPGGEAWINSSTLLGRKQWVERVFRGSDAMPDQGSAEMPEMRVAKEAPQPPRQGDPMRRALERGMVGYGFDADRWQRGLAKTAAGAAPVDELVLAMPPVNAASAEMDAGSRVRALVADPAYQLR